MKLFKEFAKPYFIKYIYQAKFRIKKKFNSLGMAQKLDQKMDFVLFLDNKIDQVFGK